MAGQAPGYQEFILPGGLPIQLPASEEGSLSEIMEAVPWYMWPGIIMYNRKYYKGDWGNKFRDFAIFGEVNDQVFPRAKSLRKNQFYKKP